jgi:arginase
VTRPRDDGWVLVGAPWDCSASHRGEEAAPEALRGAGIGQLAKVDAGDAPTAIRSPVRDRETGVLALGDTLAAAAALDAALTAVLADVPENRPLVVGGDCSILLGILPAVRRTFGPIGLWFVDGHPDFQDAHASETGETADLELACITGAGPAPLVALVDDPPMVRPRDTVLIGHRTHDLDAGSAAELLRLPAELTQLDAATVQADPIAAGSTAAARLEGVGGRSWLHIDLDALDPEALPAVTYPQPGGPSWLDLTALLEPLARSPRLLGVSLADFRPDLDPDGTHARRIVRLLAELLA